MERKQDFVRVDDEGEIWSLKLRNNQSRIEVCRMKGYKDKEGVQEVFSLNFYDGIRYGDEPLYGVSAYREGRGFVFLRPDRGGTLDILRAEQGLRDCDFDICDFGLEVTNSRTLPEDVKDRFLEIMQELRSQREIYLGRFKD